MRRYLSSPRLSVATVAVGFLFSMTALILCWIALASNTWVTFVNENDQWYSVGLFNACNGNTCSYAWTSKSPIWTISPNGTIVQTWLFYTNTPSDIVSAQFFFLLGVFINMFTYCFWVPGSGFAVTSQLTPAIFYTVGFSCAASFFLSAQDNPNIYGFNTGYAFACGAAGMTLSWLATFVLIADAIVIMKAGRAHEVSYEVDPYVQYTE